MIWSPILIILIGILQCKLTISAYIDYEPIKITVNENFNTQPGQIAEGLPIVEPGLIHQGANFYFRPHFYLPPAFVPSYIEDLVSSIREKSKTYVTDTSKVEVEEDKVTKIIEPINDLVPLFRQEKLSDVILEEGKNTEIIKPLEILPSEIIAISEETPTEDILTDDVKITEEAPIPIDVLIGGNLELPPPPPPLLLPTVINEEPNPIPPQLLDIPEAPILPPLSLEIFPTVEEVNQVEPIILEESIKEIPSVPEILTRPVPELLIAPEITNSFLLENIPPRVIEEVKIEEPIITEQPIEEVPPIPGIFTGQIPTSIKTPEIGDSFVFENIPPELVQEVKIKEPIIMEQARKVIPPVREIFTSPIQEPIIEPETIGTFVLENNNPKVEEVKIEKPIILEQSIEEIAPILETIKRPILRSIVVPEYTDTFVEQAPQGYTCPECVTTVQENFHSEIQIPRNRLGQFTYAPFVSHLPKYLANSKKNQFGKWPVEQFPRRRQPVRNNQFPYMSYRRIPTLEKKYNPTFRNFPVN